MSAPDRSPGAGLPSRGEDLARWQESGPTAGWLAIAGLGPGAAELVTPQVEAALAAATDVVGYGPDRKSTVGTPVTL